jgi:predicted PurR-regulated permease PerM
MQVRNIKGGVSMKLRWSTCFKVGVSIFLLYLAVNYWQAVADVVSAMLGAAMPLIIGAFIAYMVNILMAKYEKWYFPKAKNKFLVNSRRPVCMTGAFASLLAILALVVYLIAPQLAEAVQIIIAAIPEVAETLLDLAEEHKILNEETLAALNAIDWQSQIGNLVNVLTSGIGSVMDMLISTVSSVFSIIVTGFLSIIFSIYILANKEGLRNQVHRLSHRYIHDKIREKVKYVLVTFNDCFRKYIVGQCIEAVILGALCTLGMWILQLPYAAMVGALIAVTALIPVAGAYIGAGVGAFMILTVDPMKALIFLIFIIVLQQLEGNLIYPRVVGSSMGLPGIWVLAAVSVGGGIMGIMGMFLGVPLAAALYRIIKEDVSKREAQEKQEQPEKAELPSDTE